MKVALVTEGTYPYVRGGVSTWVDQVVNGLDDVEFDITAITSGNPSPPAYNLPSNVRRVVPIDSWGDAPRIQRTPKRVTDRFCAAWETIATTSLERPSRASGDVVAAWLELSSPAIATRLFQLINSSRGVGILMEAHSRGRGSAPSSGNAEVSGVHEFVFAAHHISRMLMPLTAPPLQADIVHATANGPSILPALAAHAGGTSVVMSEHGVYFRERLLAHGKAAWSTRQREIVTAVLRSMVQVGYAVSGTIAPCTAYNRRWELRLGAQESQLRTLHNGVDLARFAPATELPSRPVLSFVGRIDPLKDLLTLIRSFDLVLQRIPEALLRIFGPVSRENIGYQEELHRECERLGIARSVQFEGPIEEPWRGYHAGSLVVMSSISEGFPYSALEAMASGRGIVATDVGGVREAIGDAGIVVPARNPDRFAEATVDLLSDPNRSVRMGRAGRVRVEQNFTLDMMLGRLRDIYRDTLDGGAGGVVEMRRGTASAERVEDGIRAGVAA